MFSLSQFHSAYHMLLDTSSAKKHQQREILVHWLPPNSDFLKLNTDGNPGLSGLGGVMHDSCGAWITGYYGFCGYTTSLHAELFGIYNGLQIAWQQGFKKIICKSDSQLAIDLILGDVNSFHLYHPLILKIQNFINLQWDLSFNHLYREGNQIADWLAKEGSSSLQDLTILLQCPTSLFSDYFADFMVHSYVRS